MPLVFSTYNVTIGSSLSRMKTSLGLDALYAFKCIQEVHSGHSKPLPTHLLGSGYKVRELYFS